MRLCLNVAPGFTFMRTISGSEPILAEGAYLAMAKETFNAPSALKRILSGHYVNQGDRGEVIVLLLLTMARDAAVGPPNGQTGEPVNKQGRVMKVADFLSKLFPKPRDQEEEHVDVMSIQPSFDDSDKSRPLGSILKTSHMHFNHFIKVHQHGLMKRKHLVCFPSRGAGVICGNGQPGIDGVIAFSAEGTRMSVKNTGLIMWQVKLDESYTDNPKWNMFDSMDPVKLGIFEDEGAPLAEGKVEPVPIIRIFFALAAKTSCLKARPRTVNPEVDARFRTYDLWCAGLDPDIVGPITSQDEDSWTGLKGFCNGWAADYTSGTTRVQAKLRREMNAGAALDANHFAAWCVAK